MSSYVLKNDQLTATFRTFGAECISVKRGACEYIWQGDPAYWARMAPMMFPICGRLFGDQYTYGGKTYQMKQHGFMRDSEFDVVDVTEDRITFVLRSSDKTKEIYPFDFVLTVTHTLTAATVRTEIRVKNTGEDVMPFTFGAHPGFNVPLEGEGAFEDYYLEFDEPCSPDEIGKTDSGYLTGRHRAFSLEDGKTIPLCHGLFDIDSIFFARAADSVTLRSKTTERSITLTYPQCPYLGIWHKPQSNAPYVCIEPWCGLPSYEGETDDFATKPNMFRLQTGAEKTVAFEISYR